MKIKVICLISTSKLIDGFVSLAKQVLSSKIASRMHVIRTLTELHEYIPKENLPIDYGGNEKSLAELHGRQFYLNSSNRRI